MLRCACGKKIGFDATTAGQKKYMYKREITMVGIFCCCCFGLVL